MHDVGRRSFMDRVVAALRHGLVLFLYLWALFGLFVLNEQLVSREHGGQLIFHGFALINALALTKVMMVAEHLEVSGWLSNRPPLLTIASETLVCTALFFVAHVIERVLVGLARGEALSASMPAFGGGGAAAIVIVALIVFVSLLPFFTFKHVARVIGPEELEAILLPGRGRTRRPISPTDE
ncbi:MAG: hypothetical protein U1E59_20915 [Amaricoccus sp.]